jgi:hypothetical protein
MTGTAGRVEGVFQAERAAIEKRKEELAKLPPDLLEAEIGRTEIRLPGDKSAGVTSTERAAQIQALAEKHPKKLAEIYKTKQGQEAVKAGLQISNRYGMASEIAKIDPAHLAPLIKPPTETDEAAIARVIRSIKPEQMDKVAETAVDRANITAFMTHGRGKQFEQAATKNPILFDGMRDEINSLTRNEFLTRSHNNEALADYIDSNPSSTLKFASVPTNTGTRRPVPSGFSEGETREAERLAEEERRMEARTRDLL